PHACRGKYSRILARRLVPDYVNRESPAQPKPPRSPFPPRQHPEPRQDPSLLPQEVPWSPEFAPDSYRVRRGLCSLFVNQGRDSFQGNHRILSRPPRPTLRPRSRIRVRERRNPSCPPSSPDSVSDRRSSHPRP